MMNRFSLFSVVFFLWFSFLGTAQHINFKNITVADGLPQSQVFDIEQDSEGALWLATQGGGVCIYDGKSFKIIDTKNGLPSSYIHAICEHNGKMYIGSDKGLSIVHGNDIVNVPFPGVRKINALEKNGDTLFIGTQNGLFYLIQERVRRYENLPAKGQSISKIIFSSDGLILSGIRSTDHYKGIDSTVHSFIQKYNPLITDFIEVGDKKFISSYNLGLFVLNKDNTVEHWLKNSKVMDLFLDTDSNLWVGTQLNGIYKFDIQSKQFENFTTKEGLANDHIRTIKQDVWGNIWIGTSGGGLSKYSGSQFLHYNKASGLNGNYIYSVLNDSRNNLWVGSSGKGVYRRNDSTELVYNQSNGFSNAKVKCIYEDSKGLIWLGTEGEGFGVYFGALGYDTIINFAKKGGLRSSWVKSFSEDKKGMVWLATAGGGLYKSRAYIRDSIPQISLSYVKTTNGEFSSRYNKIIHNSGRLILATADKGIGILENKNLKIISITDGLNSNSIRGIEADDEGRVWYVSDQGLGYINQQDSVINFTRSDGLASTNCYQILMDDEGAVWVGSERGLDHIFLVGQDSINVTHFGYNEGFKGVETTLNACCKDQSNRLWFGSVNGLSMYAPREKMTNTNPPILTLKKYNLFYQSIFKTPFGIGRNVSDTIILPYKENGLSFEFNALYLANPESVKYQYKLKKDGVDQPQLTNASEIQYANLSPGFYELEVRASANGLISDPIYLNFKVTPPYWQTTWFLVLTIIGGLLLTALVIYLIYKRIQKKLEAEKSKLEIEKNLAELEQKALRLQMNPHFLFNILNSVQFLIQENDQQKARYALGKFAKLMRQILENSREKLISIEDEMSTIKNYIALEKLTTSTDFEFNVIYDDEIDTIEEILPPLMIQPFVENAIIHAFKGLKRKAEITISFTEFEEYLEIEVRDNGIGRKQAKLNRAQVETYHKSQALHVTQERLSNLNDDQKFKGFEIKDHFAGEEPMGTSVFLRLKH